MTRPDPMLTMFADPDVDEGVLWLTWLVRLRWVALLAQTVTLAFTFTVLDSAWLIAPLGVVMVVLAAANVEAMRALATHKEVTQGRLLVHLSTEILALTVFLMGSGGPENPFVVLYFIHVCMGAVMLTWGKATIITTLALGCYGALHVFSFPLHLDRHSVPPDLLHDFGAALAFVITVISASGFTIGVSRTLRGHKVALLEARDRTARVDRLRTVGTLAAGAAHELNTPLFTMGLRLRRIKRRFADDDATMGDVGAIKTQLDRCKEIVDQLLIGAGDPSASGLERRHLAELVRGGAGLWAKGADVELIIHDDGADDLLVEVPPVPFRQALINLLENAREAQGEIGVEDPLELYVEREGDLGIVRVRDHGCGLPDEPDSVGDPFFTTKAAGTGLGVYVARSVADGAGGGLRYSEEKGEWTEAVWWFPLVQDDARSGRSA